MGWITLAIIGIPVGAVIVFVRSRARYYQRMFSEEHLREVYEQFVALVEKLSPAAAEPPPDPPAFLTSAGLVVVVTREPARGDEPASMHISFSQPGGPTTMAVASRFGFLLLATLQGNEVEVVPYYTQARIYHLSIQHPRSSLELVPLDQVLADYQSYQPLPYRYQPTPQDADAVDH